MYVKVIIIIVFVWVDQRDKVYFILHKIARLNSVQLK